MELCALANLTIYALDLEICVCFSRLHIAFISLQVNERKRHFGKLHCMPHRSRSETAFA